MPSLLGSRHTTIWIVVAAIYGVNTVAMITPFVDLRTLGTATFVGDGRLVVWTIAWVGHAITTGLRLFEANIYFPATHALAYTEHMVTLGLLGLPIQLLTGNPVAAFSTLWLASFWTNAMSAHLLAFRLTGRHSAAMVAGLIFGWSYFRVLHLAHLQLQWTAWLPLGMLLLERWHRSPSFAKLLSAVFVSLAQILTSWYVAVITVILNALWLGWLTWRDPRGPTVLRLRHAILCAALGAVVVLPLVSPYLQALAPGPVADFSGGSADLGAYIMPPENTAVGTLLTQHTSLARRSIWGEQTLFLGWIALALAGCAFGKRPPDPKTGVPPHTPHRTFFAGLALLGFALSLGPTESGLAPFDLLMDLPGLSLFRAPARFALLVLLAVAMLAALGAARICGVLERRWGAASAWVAVAVLGIAMLAEWYPVGPNVPRAEVKPLPAIYNVLRSLPPGGVVSLPDYRLRPQWFLRADYLLYASFHWRPIVNGYGRSEPPEYLSTIEQLSAFPSPSSAELAKALGVRYFVIHSDEMQTGRSITELTNHEPFQLLARVGPDYLFEIADAPWP